MKLHAIIQARTGSSRLPNKVLKIIEGKTVLEHIIDRISFSKYISKIIVATTNSAEDKKIIDLCNKNKITSIIGSSNNVLSRYYKAAKINNSKDIVRVTSDDPFKDFQILDIMAAIYFKKKFDVVTNTNPPTFPEGLDVEIFSFSALAKAFHESKSLYEQEHVTQFFYKNPDIFKIFNYTNDTNLSYLRWTLDTKEDYLFVKKIYKSLYKKNDIFLMKDILKYIQDNPKIIEINSKVEKSSMYQ